MNQTSIHGIAAGTPARDMGDNDLIFLWSQALRNRGQNDETINAVLDIVRGKRDAVSVVEERLADIARQMAERNLFAAHCIA